MIDTNEKLAAILPRLAEAEWIAVDTEADSLHAYPEKLCLLQISVEGLDALVDPLSSRLNLDPVFEVLQRHVLIMHGADYDLRLLRKHHEFVPSAIFDTMIAARLLGDKQFGLTDLVSQYVGVKLEKGPQKANWGRRPLTPRMHTYAENDTRHLKPLADILRARLDEKGRLAWHKEACAQLVAECAEARVPGQDVVWRVKGSHRLQPTALGILRELWHWREQEAVRANKPPYFVLSPDAMVQLASVAVESAEMDEALPVHLSPRRREGILKAIQRGRQLTSVPSMLRAPHYRQTEAEKRRMHELTRRRDQRAAQLQIDPTLIASRAMLVLLAKDWEKHQAGLMRWQRDLLSNHAP